jgi:hypothetical protein
MTIGKYLLFLSLLINTGINLSPLKSWIKDILRMGESNLKNIGLSALLVSTLGVLAYIIPDINLIMDIAGGVFGIPMIFLFPALVGIRKKVFKNLIA